VSEDAAWDCTTQAGNQQSDALTTHLNLIHDKEDAHTVLFHMSVLVQERGEKRVGKWEVVMRKEGGEREERGDGKKGEEVE